MRSAINLLLFAALAAPAADLEHRINALVESSAAAGMGFSGIEVVELKSGKTLYRHNAVELFLPASNMKLFTTALALVRLGPDYRFVTRVAREPSGDLALIGSGDPSLSGRMYPYQKDAASHAPLQAIEDLADQAAAKGLRRVEGDIVGDDSLYPWEPYPASWSQDDAWNDFGAPVSALSVADNVITLNIEPGARVGDPAALTLDPGLEYFAIDNRIATVNRGGESAIRVVRLPGTRQLLLTGSIALGHAALREITPVDDPALYAACALYDALTRRGILVLGRPVSRHRPENAPPDAADDNQARVPEILASRSSPPLRDLLQVIDKASQNLHAELMLREVGRVTRRSATGEAGLAEMAGFLTAIGASAGDFRGTDGSGLSRNAMVTPRVVTRLLQFMYAPRYRDSWISLLPVGGEDGTLEHRLCCVSDGRGIHAKTGSLSRAAALSGYADSKTGGPLAFSILVNNFSAPAADVREWIDKIAMTLLE